MTAISEQISAEFDHLERLRSAALVVLSEHRARIGPISGHWACDCGTRSTCGKTNDNTLASHEERRQEWREHLATALAEGMAHA